MFNKYYLKDKKTTKRGVRKQTILTSTCGKNKIQKFRKNNKK